MSPQLGGFLDGQGFDVKKAGEPEYFVVAPGQKISAIRTTTSGTLTATMAAVIANQRKR